MSHHDPSDPNFNAHVLLIGGNAFCIGCTASKTFMYLIFPILAVMTLQISYLGIAEYFLIGSLSIAGVISVREMIRGKPLSSQFLNSIPPLTQVLSVLYVAMRPTSLDMSSRLLLATLLGTPQILLYIRKIVSRKEFNRVGTKFVIRVMMIIGFFFAVSDLASTPVISLVFIVSTSALFLKLRKFSGYRVGNDQIAILNPVSGKLTRTLQSHNFVDQYGSLSSTNTWLLLAFFLVGLVSIVSTSQPTVCSNSTTSVAASVPWLVLSSPNFCPNCGDKVEPNERFCNVCGEEIGGSSNQPNRNRAPLSNNTGQYSDPYYSQGGGYYESQPRGRVRQDSEAKGVAIGAGIVVFLFALLVTQSFPLSVIAGLLAFGGVLLASSTDNCCAQYLIMDCCCECVCDLIGSGSNNRRR